jgi:hypothetical protein
MGSRPFSKIADAALRRTAFAIEQMSPGGIEREGCGVVSQSDLRKARQKLEGLLSRSGLTPKQAESYRGLIKQAEKLMDLINQEDTQAVIYLADQEYELPTRLRSAAIEIDFCFGDRDGVLSEGDINEARRRYGLVRGPVGWNRILLTDEIERRLFPNRTLDSTEGLRLLPEDWLVEGSDPLIRLRKVIHHLDDGALARTYADVAARLATIVSHEPGSDLGGIFEGALVLLGQQIRQRDSVRPSITDIARIGCEDPAIKALLSTPIEMSRKLNPETLITKYLN